MKIVIIGTAYPYRGGLAHYNAILYRHLSLRHSVRIFTFTRQYPRILFPGKSQEDENAQEIKIPTAQAIDSINPLTWWEVGRRVRELKPECVVIKYWMPFFAPCFGAISRLIRSNDYTKVIFICDNIIPHEKFPFGQSLTRYAFSAIDGAIVQSDAVEKELLQLFPRLPYKKVPHPIYEIYGVRDSKENARAALGLSQEHVILFFGFVRPYKGLKTLIHALPLVKKSVPIHLVIAGEFYEDEKKYRLMIHDLGMDTDVTIRSDYIPQPDVGKYFSACDCVVLPYTSATQSGIVQIAYQFDRPVIVTNVGGLSEVVLDGITGYTVPSDNPTALAEAIIKFYMENKESEFVQNVEKEKQKYSWDAMVSAIEELASRQPPPVNGESE
jgi:glycosyltransferase involved in cell wall biosynthesis